MNERGRGAIPVVTTGAQGLFPPPIVAETNGTPVVLNSRSYTFTNVTGLPITTDLSDSKIQILPQPGSSALETANQHICSWLFTDAGKQHSLPAGVPCTFTFVAAVSDVNIDENPEVLLPSPHTVHHHVAPWEAVDGFFYNVEAEGTVVQSKFVVPGTPGVETTFNVMEWVGIPTPAFSPTSTNLMVHPTTIATVTADENGEAASLGEGLKTLPAFTQANKSGAFWKLLYTVSDAQRRGKAMVSKRFRKEAMGPLSIDATKGYLDSQENKHDVEVGRDAATGRLAPLNVEHAKRLGAVKQLLEHAAVTETELYIGYVKTGSSRVVETHAKVENGTPKYVMDVIQHPDWYIDLSAAFPTNHQNRTFYLVYVTEEVDLRFGSSTYKLPTFSGPTESVVIAGVETAEGWLDYVYCGGIAMSSSDFVAAPNPVSPAYLAHRDQVMLHNSSLGTWTRSSAPHGIGRMAPSHTLRQIGDLGALNYGVGLTLSNPTLVSVDGTQFGLYLPHTLTGLNYATLGEITGGKTRRPGQQVTFPAAILALFDFYNNLDYNNVNVLDIYYFTLKPTISNGIGIGTATPLTLAQVACMRTVASEFILAANNAGKALFSIWFWDKMKQMIIDGAPAGAANGYHNVSGTFTIHADRLTLSQAEASPGTELNGWYCTGPETFPYRVVDSTTYENLSQMCHIVTPEFDPNTTYSGKAGYGPTNNRGANSRLIWLSQPRTRLAIEVMLNQGRGSIYELGMAYPLTLSWYEYLSCDYNFTARSFSAVHAGDRDLMPYVTITTLDDGVGQANNRTFATSQDKYIVSQGTTVRYNGGAEIGIPSRKWGECSSMTITLEGADRFPIVADLASTTGQTINFKQWVSSFVVDHAIGVDGLNFRVGLTPTVWFADASAKWNSARNFVHGPECNRQGQKRSDTDVLVAPVTQIYTFVADVLTGGMLTSGDNIYLDYFVSMRSIALDELNLGGSNNDLIVCNERVYLLRTVLTSGRNGNAAGVITTAPWVVDPSTDGTIDHAKHHRVVKVQLGDYTGTDAMICLGSDGAYYLVIFRYRPAGMSAYPGVNLVAIVIYAYADVSPSNTLENMQQTSVKVYSLRNGSNGNPPGDWAIYYEGYTKNQTWQKGLARYESGTVGGSSYGNNNFLPIPVQGNLLEQKIDTLNDKIGTLLPAWKLWDAIDTTSDKMVTSRQGFHTIADLDNVPYASTSVTGLAKPVTNALRTVLSGKALTTHTLTLTAADFGIEKMDNTGPLEDDTYTVNGKGFVLDANGQMHSTAISQKAVTDLKNKLDGYVATTTVQGLFAITNLSASAAAKIYGSGKETNKVYMNAELPAYLTSVKILPANAYFKSSDTLGVLAPVYNSVYLVTPDMVKMLNTLWVHSGKAGDKWGAYDAVLKADQDNNEPGIATEFSAGSGHVISMKGEKFIITSTKPLGDLLGRMRVLNNDAITFQTTLMSTSGIQQKHVDMLLDNTLLGKAVDATKAFGRTLAELVTHHLIKNAHGYTCGDIGALPVEVTDLIYQNGKQVFDDEMYQLEDIRLGILERAHELDEAFAPIDPPKDLEEAILRDEIVKAMKDPRNCDWSELMKYPPIISVGRQYRIPASEIGKYLVKTDAIYGSIMLLNATEVEYELLSEGLDYFLGHYFQELAEAENDRIGLTLTVTDKTTGTKRKLISTATYPNRYSTVIPVEAPFYYRLGVFAMPREDAAQFNGTLGRVVRR
ncbi:hypothetical protein SPFM20_00108 [Salmonella phage SPFM20]|nr:hypothetical protein SPFM20_00108 [Salmonella phage SPFM20]